MAEVESVSARDRGQAAVTMLLAAVVLFVVVVAALAAMGGAMIDRTRAQSVADAAALASVGRGRLVAVELVRETGGHVEAWSSDAEVSEVTVVVRVGRATAVATATDAP